MKYKKVSIVYVLIVSIFLSVVMSGTVFAENESFSVSSSASSIINGNSVDITVNGANMNSFYGYELSMTYDSSKLELENVGYAVNSDISFNKEISGVLTIVGSMKGNSGNIIASDGTLCTLKFKAKLTGNADVTLSSVKLSGKNLVTSDFLPATKVTVSIKEKEKEPDPTDPKDPDPNPNPGPNPNPTPTPTPTPTPKPTPSPSAPTASKFEDLGKYGWAKKAIESLVEKGIISGTSKTKYSPAAKITRADFMVLLVKTLGLSASGNEDNFSDVSPSKYYYEAINVAKKLGITNGTGNNKFNPTEPISRQDIMVMVYKALKVAGKELATGKGTKLDSFKDKKDISNYAIESIEALLENGIIEGSGNSINPKGNATRAESACIIYNIYSKFVQAQE